MSTFPFPADKGGDPEKIRESQRRRYADVGLVDRVVELDTEWRDGGFRVPDAGGPDSVAFY